MFFGRKDEIESFDRLWALPGAALAEPVDPDAGDATALLSASGLVVDFLSEGVLGLNALALIPVAFARHGIIGLIFGPELFARKEDFSVGRCGFGKVAVSIFLALLIFLVIYIWADGAGTRPLWFNGLRLAASLVASFVVSLLTLGVLAPDPRK